MTPPPPTAAANAVSDVGAPADVADIVRRAASGDTAAFELLYRRHAGLVYATCLRISGRPAVAEELAQETFVRVWRALPAMDEPAGFAPWVARIAVNVALDERRAFARKGAREAAIADDSVAADVGRHAEGAHLDLERAIAALPDGARSVFVLFDIEGWSHQRIAERLGIAEATSKTQLHRARRLLREALAP